MAVSKGKNAQFYIPTVPSVPLTVPEPCQNLSADLTNYQITAAGHRYVDKQVAATLEFSTGGAWNPVVNSGTSAYTIQWIGGWVRFAQAQPASTAIRFASGNYFAVAACGGAHLAKLASKAILFDDTDFTFAAGGGKHFDATLVEATITCTRWFLDVAPSYFHDNSDQLLVIVLYINVLTGTRFETYARLTDDGVDAAVAGILAEPLTFRGEGSWVFIP
jgi:hypothetical protein